MIEKFKDELWKIFKERNLDDALKVLEAVRDTFEKIGRKLNVIVMMKIKNLIYNFVNFSMDWKIL